MTAAHRKERTRSAARVAAALLGAALLAALPAADAGELLSARSSEEHGRYSLEVAMHIDAEVRATRAWLLAFDQMPLYNRSVVRSHRRSSRGGVTTVEVTMHDCIWAMCMTMRQVEEVRELPSGDLAVTIIPRLSDFRMGRLRWHLEPAPEGGTVVRVAALLEPRAVVPPLVGPALVCDLLRTRAVEMIHGLEALASARRGA